VFLLNQKKPTVGKPFRAEKTSVLVKLPELKLDAHPEFSGGPSSPNITALMDHPKLIQFQIAPIEVYGQLFIYQVTPVGQIVLYAYVNSRPRQQTEASFEKRLVLDLEGGGGLLGDSPLQSPGGGRPFVSPFFKNQSGSEGALSLASSALSDSARHGGGRGSTAANGGGATQASSSSPARGAAAGFSSHCQVRLQVVDDLLVAHFVHLRRTGVFDISLGLQNTMNVISPAGDSFAAQPSPTEASTSAAVDSNRFPATPSSPATTTATATNRHANPTSPLPYDAGSAGSGSFGTMSSARQSSATSSSQALKGVKHLRVATLAPLQVILCDGNVSNEQQHQPHQLYLRDVYMAGPQYMPLVLDRETLQVSLFTLDARAVAHGIRDLPMRVQFLLNRFACGGDAIPELITRLLREHEPATTVAQIFDLISAHNFLARSPSLSSHSSLILTKTASAARKRNGGNGLAGSSGGISAAERSPFLAPLVIGSPVIIGRLFPAPTTRATEDTTPSSPPSSWLTQDIVARHGCGNLFCDPTASAASDAKAALFRGSFSEVGAAMEEPDSILTLDQLTMYRMVFAPLTEECASQLPQLFGNEDEGGAAIDDSTAPIETPQQQQNLYEQMNSATDTAADRGAASPSMKTVHNATTDNRSTTQLDTSVTSTEAATQYAASYLLYALLEYARSLIQHGDALSDPIQRCIVNIFLQTPPNYFRLHQLLMYRAVDDHIPTALQLITLESQYPPAFQMGLDMLSRLGAQNEIVQVLVAKRLPLAAAKYVFTTSMVNAPVLDILFCASLLHDEEIARRKTISFAEDPQLHQQLPVDAAAAGSFSPRSRVARTRQARKERRELSAQAGEFHTIFTLMLNYLLAMGDERVMMQPAFEVFKARYNKISTGQLL
jgi:hypothetical protein